MSATEEKKSRTVTLPAVMWDRLKQSAADDKRPVQSQMEVLLEEALDARRSDAAKVA